MEFGIPRYDDLVWNVSLISDRIGSSMQHGLNGKLQLGDYLNARARIKNNRHRRDYAAKNIAFAPAILPERGIARLCTDRWQRVAQPIFSKFHYLFLIITVSQSFGFCVGQVIKFRLHFPMTIC